MQVCSVCSRAKTNLSTGAMCPYPYQNQCYHPPVSWVLSWAPHLAPSLQRTLRELLPSTERTTDKISFSSTLLRNSTTSYGHETPPLYTLNLCFWTLGESGPMFHARHPAMCLMEFIETSRAGFNLPFQSPWVWKCTYQEEREGKERETRNQSTKWVHLKPQPALMWGLILLSGLTPLPQVLGLRGDRFPLWIA